MDAYFQWLREKQQGESQSPGNRPRSAEGIRWIPSLASPLPGPHTGGGTQDSAPDPTAIGYFCCCLSII
jgi:hypothetical protein